ncbi:hypothetical protein [Egibacter rhizosphaerae]|uniref:hypothetical protein n=1 Tax=Egibacter rhizosphaerae TaxID=1670831 RepID=UPI00197AFBB8|nr:hypothetical protein [Egibacter rhizosphaerae]
MTTIKATCPHCGEVSLTPADIDLRVDPGEPEDASYGFVCPDCAAAVRKPADQRIVRLLVSGGVEVRDPEPEPLEQRPAAPPLTRDDLLDFHRLLESDDWFQQLLTNTPEDF